MAETVEVPIGELTVEQMCRLTLRGILDIQDAIVVGGGGDPTLEAEVAQAVAHINASTQRLRDMTAALTEGDTP